MKSTRYDLLISENEKSCSFSMCLKKKSNIKLFEDLRHSRRFNTYFIEQQLASFFQSIGIKTHTVYDERREIEKARKQLAWWKNWKIHFRLWTREKHFSLSLEVGSFFNYCFHSTPHVTTFDRHTLCFVRKVKLHEKLHERERENERLLWTEVIVKVPGFLHILYVERQVTGRRVIQRGVNREGNAFLACCVLCCSFKQKLNFKQHIVVRWTHSSCANTYTIIFMLFSELFCCSIFYSLSLSFSLSLLISHPTIHPLSHSTKSSFVTTKGFLTHSLFFSFLPLFGSLVINFSFQKLDHVLIPLHLLTLTFTPCLFLLQLFNFI